MRILVTGVAGFIGAATALRLLSNGHAVIGVDNLSDYYDVGLKRARLVRLSGQFRFLELDLADRAQTAAMFAEHRPEQVVHLAAQPGVRYSLDNPSVYIDSNLTATANVLEGCRQVKAAHLVFASSSSVYGSNSRLPWSTRDNVDHPLSLYAATKKSCELMAHSYSHLFSLPTTGLRFFTVYGPWGRPDMAPMLFAKAIYEDRPISVFNYGHMSRDFTYVDDIVEGVLRVLAKPPRANPEWARDQDPSTSHAPYRIYNLGNSQPVPLLEFIATLETLLGKKSIEKLLPLQAGDVVSTFADTHDLERDFNWRPRTLLTVGLTEMVAWYKSYYG